MGSPSPLRLVRPRLSSRREFQTVLNAIAVLFYCCACDINEVEEIKGGQQCRLHISKLKICDKNDHWNKSDTKRIRHHGNLSLYYHDCNIVNNQADDRQDGRPLIRIKTLSCPVISVRWEHMISHCLRRNDVRHQVMCLLGKAVILVLVVTWDFLRELQVANYLIK